MRMLPKQESRAFSAPAEKLFKFQWDCDRRLAGESAADVGRGLPIQLATILQERHGRGLRVWCPQGYGLEGPVAIANEVQRYLRVSDIRIADQANLLGL